MTFAHLKINGRNKSSLFDDISFSLEIMKCGLNFTITSYYLFISDSNKRFKDNHLGHLHTVVINTFFYFPL